MPSLLPTPIRALRAKEAGEYLAKILGLPTPIPAPRMWRYARLRYVRVIHLGRRVLFSTEALDEFVEKGGTIDDPHKRQKGCAANA